MQKRMITAPFMQSVTIRLYSNSALIALSDDIDDTTWQQSVSFGNAPQTIYLFGSRIDSMTRDLNTKISIVAHDRSKSPQKRALEIINLRREYGTLLQHMVDSIRHPEMSPQNDQSQQQQLKENAAPEDSSKVNSGNDNGAADVEPIPNQNSKLGETTLPTDVGPGVG